ncbi:hypothetical protein HWD35_10375 [Tsukamurella tyrosinosolvens]|uniref:hypothetical protein n=1 Tax=Tsukamurella tyrosinosolvens TaxID=57704 RepID=UPI001CE07CFE|nr:hypothetical protein [Tsukamurella tyrosinosolvens]MCA4995117.1 hypothetical protein [Tsukamurella tyrosinosolvens]
MSRAEELWIAKIDNDLSGETDTLHAYSDKAPTIDRTFSLEGISIAKRSRTTLYFNAESDGTHFRGFYSPEETVDCRGRVTIVYVED